MEKLFSPVISPPITSALTVVKSTVTWAIELHEIRKDYAYKHKAFEYAEKGKSLILLSAMQEVKAKNKSNIPKEYQETYNKIKEELDRNNHELYLEQQKIEPIQKSELIPIAQNIILSMQRKIMPVEWVNSIGRD